MDEANTERWRGRVDAKLDNLQADMARLDAKTEKLSAQLQLTNLEIKGVATRIGTWATGGAILGGGIISLLIKVFFN